MLYVISSEKFIEFVSSDVIDANREQYNTGKISYKNTSIII